MASGIASCRDMGPESDSPQCSDAPPGGLGWSQAAVLAPVCMPGELAGCSPSAGWSGAADGAAAGGSPSELLGSAGIGPVPCCRSRCVHRALMMEDLPAPEGPATTASLLARRPRTACRPSPVAALTGKAS